MSSRRKLAVILHADVADSTALVQHDESLAHDRIRDVFDRFAAIIDSYQGTTREIRGDALLAEFARASDALSAALVFQDANADHNQTLSDEIRPVLRVGISLGEVVIADATMTGAGVVLAQRLEQLASPGGVVVQGTIAETIPTRLPFDYEDLGEQSLKGFENPVRTFAATLSAGEAAPVPEPADDTVETRRADTSASAKPSIAVLPFTNMSADPEQAFFADGMTEDLTAALSQLTALTVAARHSAFAYKGTSTDIRAIANDLGVRYLLEGSVQKSGQRARITAQLIDGASGNHLWAERYNRDLDDIFEVQDEIARNISIALQVELSYGSHARIWQAGTRSFEAWLHQVRAVQAFYKFTREGRNEAAECFKRVLEIDPDFAPALAGLGHTYYQMARYGGDDVQANLDRMLVIAERLLQDEKTRHSGHALQSNVRLVQARHEEAIAECEKAIELAPDNPDQHGRFAHLLAYAGHPERSLHHSNRALQLSPRHPNWFTTAAVLAHYLLGDLDSARQVGEEALARFPDFSHAYVNLAAVYSALGDVDQAAALADQLMRMQPEFSVNTYMRSQIFKDPNDASDWATHLLAAGLAP